MLEVFAAFAKAARDLTRREILWHALWPALAALFAWTAIGFLAWSNAVGFVAGALPAFEGAVGSWFVHWAAVFLVLAGFGSLTYATAILLVALVGLPRMLALVAARDYPDVLRHGESPFRGSLRNTLAATALFVSGWLLTLPLLLIPGAVLVLPLLWTAWFDQRTFRFDALAEHATSAEIARLVASGRGRYYAAGFGTALTAHIPLLNLLAPAYTALVFVHLGLTSLRRLRHEAGVEL